MQQVKGIHIQISVSGTEASGQAHPVTAAFAKYCAPLYHLARIAFIKNHPDLETLVLCSSSKGRGQHKNSWVQPSAREQYPEPCSTAQHFRLHPDATCEGGGGETSEKGDAGLMHSLTFYLIHLPLPLLQENLSHSKGDSLKFQRMMSSLIDNVFFHPQGG